MSNKILGLSIDAADAAALADFWAQALGRQLEEGAGKEYAVVAVDTATVSVPRLVFHQVPEGKTTKNRLHLDLISQDGDGELSRLISLGATRIRDVEVNGASWTTLADPEGNEFDLVRG
jgi:predicted enzyme related to lactoylglutathione lyase